MSFHVEDRHVEEFLVQGYTVFEGLIPSSLLTDLRRATDHAREIAREQNGPQAQRLQPVRAFDLDQKPFEDYQALPELREAIHRVLTPRHETGSKMLGVLFEPANKPWCTIWHRDWRDNIPGVNVKGWTEHFHDINFFNQVNCALYEDDSTWVVPGSHLRPFDLDREKERFPSLPFKEPDMEGQTNEERERTALAYCQSMPGAVRLRLNAGDYALYRNTLWHIGNYVPYRKRATLHDTPVTPEFEEWFLSPEKHLEKA